MDYVKEKWPITRLFICFIYSDCLEIGGVTNHVKYRARRTQSQITYVYCICFFRAAWITKNNLLKLVFIVNKNSQSRIMRKLLYVPHTCVNYEFGVFIIPELFLFVDASLEKEDAMNRARLRVAVRPPLFMGINLNQNWMDWCVKLVMFVVNHGKMEIIFPPLTKAMKMSF